MVGTRHDLRQAPVLDRSRAMAFGEDANMNRVIKAVHPRLERDEVPLFDSRPDGVLTPERRRQEAEADAAHPRRAARGMLTPAGSEEDCSGEGEQDAEVRDDAERR